jgi:hypothetical protein
MGEGSATVLSEAAGGGQIQFLRYGQDLDLAAVFPRRLVVWVEVGVIVELSPGAC